MNKGILILGSVGSGKSYFSNELYDFNENLLDYFWMNPDDWVEEPSSEFYNNPLQASKYCYGTIIPDLISENKNFILQNTGANSNTLRKIIDNPNYQFKIVMVYCNPIIAFLRNFSRERKVPKQIVLENWLKVYSNIEEYINIVGNDNIYIYETEYTEKEKDIIYKKPGYYSSVYKELKGIKVESSFKKEETKYTYEEIVGKAKKFTEISQKIDASIQQIENQFIDLDKSKEFIKEELNKWINQ